VADPQGGGLRSKGNGVSPDLQGRVAHLDERDILEDLGDSQAPNWIIRSHSAQGQVHTRSVHLPATRLLDHERNIFVVQRVEVRRVTKLRKVA